MAKVAIVGGSGKVARQLHSLLGRAGHTPVALVRSDKHGAELAALGAEVRLLDIEQAAPAEFARAFDGCQAVVFSAGAGADGKAERKRTVDLEGSLKSIEASRFAGIRRFVQISAIAVDAPIPADASAVWRAYVEAKRDADTALRASDLDWTILRPGSLSDDPATLRVLIANEVPRGSIPRADVAAVTAAVIDNEATIGCQWELVQGDLPIAEAIAAAAAAHS